MVDINFARRRPPCLLDLSRVEGLEQWRRSNGVVELGAGVTYTEVIDHLRRDLPALTMASRTVGSPQIRNRGTIGGNLVTASPAGDAHPPLLATSATVRVDSMHGVSEVPIGGFFTGPKRSVLEPDELIRSVSIPAARGPQQFSKVGARHAMVIAVVSFAVAVDLPVILSQGRPGSSYHGVDGNPRSAYDVNAGLIGVQGALSATFTNA